MTPPLRHILPLLALLAFPTSAHADGRDDWSGYAWQQIKATTCRSDGAMLRCPPYHQKWDWKRNQWVDIAISIDLAEGTFHLTQRLTDNDRTDNDDVCVTVLAVDAAGLNILAHHQNWYMRHGEAREESFSYRSTRLADIATIHLGSKQCRKGSSQDDALYQQVLAGIGN